MGRRWVMAAVAAVGMVLVAGCANVERGKEEVGRGVVGVRSPDGRIGVTVAAGEELTYSVSVDGKTVIAPSQLGLEFRGELAMGPGARVVKVGRRRVDRRWENRLGKNRLVRDRFDEARVTLRQESMGREFDVVVRVYDDGVAVRYELPDWGQKGPMILERELTEFGFAKDARCWAGSQVGGFRGAQEWEFWPTTLSALPKDRPVGLPLLVKTDAAYVAVAESDLLDYSGMWVSGGAGAPTRKLTGKQVPEPVAGEPGDKPVTVYAHLAPRLDGEGLVKMTLPHRTPWRVLMIGREAGRLVESNLIDDLATPAKVDGSWVKPGMMAWDHWWSGDVKMDTPTLEAYIQLAHDMGWAYQLIDWQWYGVFDKPGADITHVNPAVDMDEVRRFAAERNVKLWVWLYWTDVEKEYEKAFALYEKWGLAGVKIDFMDRDDQEMVNWYEKIAKAAAAHHLMVDFHGAFKPTGMERTYPNQVTREGVLGNEYNRWSKRATPEHKVTLAFTRFLLGPGDFTPGGFLNRQPSAFKIDPKMTEVQGTRGAELALFVVYGGPVICACDRPAHYEGAAGSDFLKVVPTVWDETRVLLGDVGEEIVVARRSGKVWYVGGMTNSQGRDLSVKTGFLGGGKWKAKVWKDAGDSDVNAEHLDVEERVVKAGEAMEVKMAPAGGFVMRLEKE